MDLLTLLTLAVGLAMDAFAVSICKGLAMREKVLKKGIIVGLWFGGFQALMPTIGFFLGTQFKDQITSIDHWIAFVLLGLIGINMVKEALSNDESLGDETISVVFFEDKGLERSQQIFTDLNKHAVKTSNSIAELYDSRDDLAVITREVISKVPFINTYTDKEKDILGKYSSNLFTLNTFYSANKRIIQKDNSEDAQEFLTEFWMLVADNMTQWNELQSKEISKVDLRENYIITQAVVIQSLGRIGNYFFTHRDENMADRLRLLREIDWRRSALSWKLRTIRANGRMINNDAAIILTANVIKTSLNIPLDHDESMREKKFLQSINK